MGKYCILRRILVEKQTGCLQVVGLWKLYNFYPSLTCWVPTIFLILHLETPNMEHFWQPRAYNTSSIFFLKQPRLNFLSWATFFSLTVQIEDITVALSCLMINQVFLLSDCVDKIFLILIWCPGHLYMSVVIQITFLMSSWFWNCQFCRRIYP